MKIIMIGTPVCMKCKSIAPKLEEYCKEHHIDYIYMNLSDAPSDIVQVLISKNVKQAPAFIIYRGEDTLILSGDDIFVELEKL